jgi:hypothetical protein
MIPFPAVLQRRSSWPSSLVTGLIGWNGFAAVAALAAGRGGLLAPLLLAATAVALMQVVALRIRLRLSRRADGVARGALWGAVTGALLAAAPMVLVPELARHPILTLLFAVYVGAPVGAFLSYFRRDDARIEAAARARALPLDFGRDAHWLDPFVYGALVYLAVFLPRAPALGAGVALVGAVTGVVAAGVSHFFLARFHNAPWTVMAAAIAGAPLGALTGLLFRAQAHLVLLPALAAGALGGGLTFLVTAAVGRRLQLRDPGAAAAR